MAKISPNQVTLLEAQIVHNNDNNRLKMGSKASSLAGGSRMGQAMELFRRMK